MPDANVSLGLDLEGAEKAATELERTAAAADRLKPKNVPVSVAGASEATVALSKIGAAIAAIPDTKEVRVVVHDVGNGPKLAATEAKGTMGQLRQAWDSGLAKTNAPSEAAAAATAAAAKAADEDAKMQQLLADARAAAAESEKFNRVTLQNTASLARLNAASGTAAKGFAGFAMSGRNAMGVVQGLTLASNGGASAMQGAAMAASALGRGFTAALGPIGLILAVITAVVSLVQKFISIAEEAADANARAANKIHFDWKKLDSIARQYVDTLAELERFSAANHAEKLRAAKFQWDDLLKSSKAYEEQTRRIDSAKHNLALGKLDLDEAKALAAAKPEKHAEIKAGFAKTRAGMQNNFDRDASRAEFRWAEDEVKRYKIEIKKEEERWKKRGVVEKAEKFESRLKQAETDANKQLGKVSYNKFTDAEIEYKLGSARKNRDEYLAEMEKNPEASQGKYFQENLNRWTNELEVLTELQNARKAATKATEEAAAEESEHTRKLKEMNEGLKAAQTRLTVARDNRDLTKIKNEGRTLQADGAAKAAEKAAREAAEKAVEAKAGEATKAQMDWSSRMDAARATLDNNAANDLVRIGANFGQHGGANAANDYARRQVDLLDNLRKTVEAINRTVAQPRNNSPLSD